MNRNVLTTDFAILGAGVMGKAGRIVVTEKEPIGRGASERPSALVI